MAEMIYCQACRCLHDEGECLTSEELRRPPIKDTFVEPDIPFGFYQFMMEQMPMDGIASDSFTDN